MKWKKLGLILRPEQVDWVITHANNPFAEYLDNSVFRIYFTGRDINNRGRGGYFDISITEPKKILNIIRKPLLEPGNLGCFDDSGAQPGSVVKHNDKKYMYYTGWKRGVTVPFYLNIGLAISSYDNGESFYRYSEAPIIVKNRYDPYLTAQPYVLIENGVWRMWYVSGTAWKIEQGRPKHYYHIKYAESKDGIRWRNNGLVCIDYKCSSEYAIASPTVLFEDGVYKMWYCHSMDRYHGYRIGYAESLDGLLWERCDEKAGIDVSPQGWDSEMVCYPCVVLHEGTKYLFYNGNAYGKSGMGLAFQKKGKQLG